MITTSEIGSPSWSSASDTIRLRMIAERISGVYSRPSITRTQSGSPTWRLTNWTTFSGLLTAWFLAILPTITSSSSKRMTEGVIRSLSLLGMMSTLPYSSKWAIAE